MNRDKSSEIFQNEKKNLFPLNLGTLNQNLLQNMHNIYTIVYSILAYHIYFPARFINRLGMCINWRTEKTHCSRECRIYCEEHTSY